MIFNKGQIDIKNFYLPDMDFGYLSEDQMLQIFNALPSHIQGIAVQWGCSDTVFRDEVLVWIVKNQFGLTTEEYYKEQLWEVQHVFDFEKLKNKKN